jgi:hypothetical protein
MAAFFLIHFPWSWQFDTAVHQLKPYQLVILPSSCRHHRVLDLIYMINETDHLFSFPNLGALSTRLNRATTPKWLGSFFIELLGSSRDMSLSSTISQ